MVVTPQAARDHFAPPPPQDPAHFYEMHPDCIGHGDMPGCITPNTEELPSDGPLLRASRELPSPSDAPLLRATGQSPPHTADRTLVGGLVGGAAGLAMGALLFVAVRWGRWIRCDKGRKRATSIASRGSVKGLRPNPAVKTLTA